MKDFTRKLARAAVGLYVAVGGGGCVWVGQMGLSGGDAGSTIVGGALVVFGSGLIALGLFRVFHELGLMALRSIRAAQASLSLTAEA